MASNPAQSGRPFSPANHPVIACSASAMAAASLPTAARAKMAVPEEIQPDMNWQVHAVLLRPVYGFRGPTDGQPVQNRHPKLAPIGGAPQVVIPNLSERELLVLESET